MIRPIAVAGFAALVAVVVAAAPAHAHVEVQPAEAAAGQPATFAFRVPNEQGSAATVSLVVHLPPGPPIAGLAAPPKPGWTIAVTPDTVTWSGGRIEPGHAEYFTLTTGPLPTDVDSLLFAADQTYSNGDIVSWNEVDVGGAEPVHPAPMLKLTGASVAPTTASVLTTAHDHDAAAPSSSSGGDGAPVALIVALSVAALAVAMAAVSLVRAPRRRGVRR